MDLKLVLQSRTVPIILSIVDVDTFKQVNDTYGHEMGDLVLQKVASVLESSFRSTDYLIRMGEMNLKINIEREKGVLL